MFSNASVVGCSGPSTQSALHAGDVVQVGPYVRVVFSEQGDFNLVNPLMQQQGFFQTPCVLIKLSQVAGALNRQGVFRTKILAGQLEHEVELLLRGLEFSLLT